MLLHFILEKLVNNVYIKPQAKMDRQEGVRLSPTQVPSSVVWRTTCPNLLVKLLNLEIFHLVQVPARYALGRIQLRLQLPTNHRKT